MSADPRLARPLDPRRTALPPQPTPPPPPQQVAPQPTRQVDGFDDGDSGSVPQDNPKKFKLKFCTVCASNQNRYVNFIERHLM